jgi:LAO/AO transport system kinase
MEIPDVLVVTKSDLGEIALRTRRDLAAALRSLGVTGTAVLAVSSLAPASGIDELADALDAHRSDLDVAAKRVRSRRHGAVTEFVRQHGERGLRALGGRDAALALLAEQPGGLDSRAMQQALEERIA